MNTELFQTIIMDHYRHPRLRGAESGPHVWYSLHNPACGDIARIAITVHEKNGVVECLHRTEGCAVSVASSSILCCSIQDKSAEQALAWIRRVRLLLQGSSSSPDVEEWSLEIQSLLAFSQVPSRQVCAALSWRCAENALEALCDKN